MIVCRDFRNLLAESTWRALQTWHADSIGASLDGLMEIAKLGDENTFLDAAAFAADDKERCLSELIPWMNSEMGHKYLMQEKQHWQVKHFIITITEALADIKQSLERNWSPARAGMLSRALPAIAASRFNSLGHTLSGILKVDANPESLLKAYAMIFCHNDRSILEIADKSIIDDPYLGTLILEMAGRTLDDNSKARFIDPSNKDEVVSCLALLLDGIMRETNAITNSPWNH